MESLTVAKFGGTSVADFEAMTRCADIVLQRPNTRVVVVSASSGVTNYLVRLTQPHLPANERDAILQHIADIQFSILKLLGKKPELAKAMELLLSELNEVSQHQQLFESPALKDQLLSYGERMSTLLFAELLRQKGLSAVNFDARQVMRTDDSFGKATPEIEQIKSLCATHILPELLQHVIVTQGFIGADVQNRTTTLGRGGSDYSAALLAEALNAEVLEIWTDVDGIYTTDPRLTERAKPIPEISFDEAAEMATFGAKILHPATLIPAMRTGTKVFVGSSRAPEKGGTWILRQVEDKPAYRAIALRKEQVLLTLKSPNMLHATGFLAEVFTILAKHKISVDLITTSEISVALTLDEPSNANKQNLSDALLAELSAVGEVKIERDLSLVAIIGNHLQVTDGVGGEVLSALQSYNLRMICHGASPHNLCFLVKSKDAGAVVAHLHHQLF
ncbi:MAG: lysine-sensitive aspartokinase 3 [Aestuariibacter sp.]